MSVLVFAVFSVIWCHSTIQTDEFDTESVTPDSVLQFFNSRFQDDLEIVSDQKTKMNDVKKRMYERVKALKVPRGESYIAAQNVVYKQALLEIWTDVLLPTQRVRFIQLVNQKDLLNLNGSVSKFLVEKADKFITLDARQKRKLEEIHSKKIEMLRKEAEVFQARVAEILASDRSASLAVLDKKQQSVFAEMFGDRRYDLSDGEAGPRILSRLMKRKRDSEKD